MGRLSLYEIHKRKGTLAEMVASIKKSPVTIESVQTVLQCSPQAAQNFMEECAELKEEQGPVQHVPKASKTAKVRDDKSLPKWIVCAGPLRGTYTRNTPTGEPEEYLGITLMLGVVHASSAAEAIETLKAKAHGMDEKLLGVIQDETLYAWQLLTL